MEKANLADYLNTLLKNDRQDELRRAIRSAADLIHDSLKNAGDKSTILQQYETLGTHLQESIVVQFSKRYPSTFPGTIPETPSVNKRLKSLQHNRANSSPESQSSPTEALLIRKKAKSKTDRQPHLESSHPNMEDMVHSTEQPPMTSVRASRSKPPDLHTIKNSIHFDCSVNEVSHNSLPRTSRARNTLRRAQLAKKVAKRSSIRLPALQPTRLTDTALTTEMKGLSLQSNDKNTPSPFRIPILGPSGTHTSPYRVLEATGTHEKLTARELLLEGLAQYQIPGPRRKRYYPPKRSSKRNADFANIRTLTPWKMLEKALEDLDRIQDVLFSRIEPDSTHHVDAESDIAAAAEKYIIDPLNRVFTKAIKHLGLEITCRRQFRDLLPAQDEEEILSRYDMVWFYRVPGQGIELARAFAILEFKRPITLMFSNWQPAIPKGRRRMGELVDVPDSYIAEQVIKYAITADTPFVAVFDWNTLVTLKLKGVKRDWLRNEFVSAEYLWFGNAVDDVPVRQHLYMFLWEALKTKRRG